MPRLDCLALEYWCDRTPRPVWASDMLPSESEFVTPNCNSCTRSIYIPFVLFSLSKTDESHFQLLALMSSRTLVESRAGRFTSTAKDTYSNVVPKGPMFKVTGVRIDTDNVAMWRQSLKPTHATVVPDGRLPRPSALNRYVVLFTFAFTSMSDFFILF